MPTLPFFWKLQRLGKGVFAVNQVMVLLAFLSIGSFVLYLCGKSKESKAFAPFTGIIIAPIMMVLATISAAGTERTVLVLILGAINVPIIWKAAEAKTANWLRVMLFMVATVLIALVTMLGLTKSTNRDNDHLRFEYPVK